MSRVRRGTRCLTGSLLANPYRVGKPLRGELAGLWTARRDAYRILYRINTRRHEVVVVRIDHRSDVYHTS